MAKDKNIRHQGSKWEYQKRPTHKPVVTNIRHVKQGKKDRRGYPGSGCAVTAFAAVAGVAGIVGGVLAVKGLS